MVGPLWLWFLPVFTFLLGVSLGVDRPEMTSFFFDGCMNNCREFGWEYLPCSCFEICLLILVRYGAGMPLRVMTFLVQEFDLLRLCLSTEVLLVVYFTSEWRRERL